ncbi:ATP-binding protein [Rhabdaerophilum sp.]|uniref:ATP-binding protein n=1 Tax=Rhabdaerophilum sp. TaxID=2717341 RepID=UPI0038D4A1AD
MSESLQPETPRARLGIGGRLGLAFGLSALFAVLAGVISWLAFERVSGSIRAIGEGQLPVVISAGQLAQLGGAITAGAPLLSRAESSAEVEEIGNRLRERAGALRQLVSRERATAPEGMGRLIDDLEENLDAIRAETLAALTMRRQNETLLREVRSLHSDFVEEAEPLVDDARIIVQGQLVELETRARGDARQVAEIRRQIHKAEAILQLSSHANLAIGLISRIAAVDSLEQLTLDSHFLAEAVDLIGQQVPPLEEAQDTLTLRQIVQRLVELSTAANGLPALRRLELAQQRKLALLLAENRTLVGAFDGEIAGMVSRASLQAGETRRSAEAAIALGRNLLLLVGIAAVVASLGVGIFYVRSNLIRRIRHLADAARMLGDGRIPPPIEISGRDELSDMARAMEGFRRAQSDLVQSAKLAALGHLSAGIAHELNQPLNAIRSHAYNASLLQERGDTDGVRHALKKVQDLTARAAHVVGHLRRFARRPDLALRPVNLHEVVEGAVLILASRLRESDTRLERDIPEGLMVEAEDIRLEQVFVNLLANALDALAGTPEPVITIRAEPRNNLVRIEVLDNGPGVPEAVRATIFDPFVTSKPPGEGVGLGLTISFSIIRDFGGALRLLPAERGAHFALELRAVPEN